MNVVIPQRGRAIGEPARGNSIQMQSIHSDGAAPSGPFRPKRRRHVEVDPSVQGIVDALVPPIRKRSQKDQDEADDRARRSAKIRLADQWQERLQLISVITTFFASIEAGMLVPLNTAPNLDQASPTLVKTANAGLLGALTIHVYAAVLSFLAAFLLIRYKLKEASKEEYDAGMHSRGILVASPENGSIHRDTGDIETGGGTQGLEMPPRERVDSSPPLTHADINNMNGMDVHFEHAYPARRSMYSEPTIFSKDPHLEQVGFWSPTISSHVLRRMHALCITLAGLGFILAIMGIMLYIWALHPKEVGILATTFLGAALVATVGVMFLPDDSWSELVAARYKRKLSP